MTHYESEADFHKMLGKKKKKDKAFVRWLGEKKAAQRLSDEPTQLKF